MKKLLPIILALIGGAAGAGAGFVFRPPPEMPCDEMAEAAECSSEDEPEVMEEPEEKQYVTMKNQFVVPIIQGERVVSLVVLSLSLETRPEESETIFVREPKLRDVFLQVLFDHSHVGGFNGTFTESSRISVLKVALLEAAQSVVGSVVSDVIITDLVRQEL